MKNSVRRILVSLVLSLLVAHSVANAGDLNTTCAPQNGSVQLEQSSIQYFRVGSGAPVMLLHGLFAQKEQWTQFACQLATGGYTVFAPDLPGYGQSVGFPIETYQLSKEVESIHAFAQKIGLKTFHIAGNSMGGAIAALYAQKYPSEVKSIAFIGAPMGVVGWSPQMREAITAGINPFIPITVDQFNLELSLLFAKPPSIDPAVKEAVVSEYVKNNRHYQQVWDIVNLDIFVLKMPKKTLKPTFITWGKEDGVFNIVGRPLLNQQFPNHVSYELKNMSHLVMLEQPNEIVDLYLPFLKSNALQ